MKCILLESVVAALIVSSYSLPLLELKPAVKLPKPSQNLGNLVEVAKSLGLTDLISAAKAADIAQFLVMGKSLTLFGPTNEAFDTIPEAYKPINSTFLKEVLLFHVIKSVVYANAIKNELLVPSILEMPKRDIRFNVYGGGKVRELALHLIICLIKKTV